MQLLEMEGTLRRSGIPGILLLSHAYLMTRGGCRAGADGEVTALPGWGRCTRRLRSASPCLWCCFTAPRVRGNGKHCSLRMALPAKGRGSCSPCSAGPASAEGEPKSPLRERGNRSRVGHGACASPPRCGARFGSAEAPMTSPRFRVLQQAIAGVL